MSTLLQTVPFHVQIINQSVLGEWRFPQMNLEGTAIFWKCRNYNIIFLFLCSIVIGIVSFTIELKVGTKFFLIMYILKIPSSFFVKLFLFVSRGIIWVDCKIIEGRRNTYFYYANACVFWNNMSVDVVIFVKMRKSNWVTWINGNRCA